MLPLLCNGYYVEFIVFWRRVGGLGKAGNATTWLDMFWVLTGVSWSRQSFWSYVATRVSLCCDMVLRLQAVAWSQHSFSVS